LEDIAALGGLATALIGVSIAHLAGIEAADGIASIAIGLILGCVAAFLSVEIKGLLVGEAASAALQAGVAQLIATEVGPGARVRAVNEIRTMQLGPNDVLVAASVDMDDAASAADVEAVTGRLDRAIRKDFPQVRHLFLEVQSAAAHRAAAGSQAAPMVQSSSQSDAAGQPLPNATGLTLVTRPPHAKKGKGKRRR
jgi:divalent metal cation (Fe/Co/Zn/Cd) transporter